jgi:exonuclease VII large subunit
MNKVTLCGTVSGMTAVDTGNMAFHLNSDDFSVPCLVEGAKSAVFYNYLMEGDAVLISGEMMTFDDAPCVRIIGLEMEK